VKIQEHLLAQDTILERLIKETAMNAGPPATGPVENA
jgi:hypothetical protein